jgi:small subunit ribosomal protein S20
VATHKSAEKRHRQSLKRRARNRHYKGEVREAVKALRNAIAAKADESQISALFQTAAATLQKVASKGILAKGNASRRVGRLAKAVSKKTTT